ncbi:MAG: aconitase X, partial [Caldisphaera sp.]|nr:aconitase X [Caldisphaera sp.]
EKPYNYNIDEVRAGVFGEILSKIHDSDKPPFINETLDKLAMKEFFASLGASGNIAMVYIDKITPEKLGKKILKEVKIDYKEIEKRKEELSPNKKPEVIYLGCPHSSAEDLYKLANILKKTNKKYDVKIVVTLSRSEIQKIESNALKILKDHNVNLIADTCLIVSPFGYKGLSVATNSYKAYFYLSKKGIDVSLISINDIPKVIDND